MFIFLTQISRISQILIHNTCYSLKYIIRREVNQQPYTFIKKP